MSGLNPGRRAAGEVLMEAERGRHVDRELARRAPVGRDRALAWALALGVLRRRGEVDAVLDPLCSRPLERLDGAVRVALRVGAYECLFQRTPVHAAIDQAVRLCEHLGGARGRGLVNAVLRRVPETPPTLPPTANHPDWLVRRWAERYGDEAVNAWCAANDRPAVLTAVPREPGGADGLVEAWRSAGLPARRARVRGVEQDGVTVDHPDGPVEGLPGWSDGAWWIMDAAALAAADLLGEVRGLRVLDACAAPGGKTLRLASRGARVTAVDLSPDRLQLLEHSLGRLGLEATAFAADWLVPDYLDPGLAGPFDAALVDAPCSGLGTVRRHPEIRWNRLPSDPAAMQLRQKPLLAEIARRVRPGGTLVYAVCSPEPEEGPAVVRSLKGWTLEHELHTAPPLDDEDGFYAARLRRNGP